MNIILCAKKLTDVAKVLFALVIVTFYYRTFRIARSVNPSQGPSTSVPVCAAVGDSWIPSQSISKPCVELPHAAKLECLLKPPNFDGQWTVENVHYSSQVSSWTWHQTSVKQHNATNSVISVPNMAPFRQYSLASLLSSSNRNAASVVFYGSSHIREVYFAMIRMARGRPFNAPLEPHIMRVGSAPFGYKETVACGDTPQDFDKRRGIDLEACGEPGKRLVPELSSGDNSSNVAIGFKTFLHTPDADDVFLEFLTANNLRHPTVLIVDVGIWGNRGPKTSDRHNPRFSRTHGVLQPKGEVEYYLQWISSNFPQTNIVYVYERGYNPTDDLEPLLLPGIYDLDYQQRQRSSNRHQRPLSWVIRKDLIQQSRPKDMPCAHGCAGPVTMVIATMILDWMSTLLTCRQVVGATVSPA
jgi:hypothetical protein